MTIMGRSRLGDCMLCGRECRLTFHHLIPVTVHKNRWFKQRFSREEMGRGAMLCTDCHSAVHKFATEKELGRDLNTVEKLRSHPEIGRFVRWVSRQHGRHRTAAPAGSATRRGRSRR